MSAVTITCSFSCHMYLTDKCNSFGGDIVLQLKDEAKHTTLSDDVTVMYSACAAACKSAIELHTYLPLQLPLMPAGLTTLYASGFLSLLIVCFSKHIKNTQHLKVWLITSLSLRSSVLAIFHE